MLKNQKAHSKALLSRFPLATTYLSVPSVEMMKINFRIRRGVEWNTRNEEGGGVKGKLAFLRDGEEEALCPENGETARTDI